MPEGMSDANVKQSVPFFGVSSMERSLRGYDIGFESLTDVPEETLFEDDMTDVGSGAS